MRILQCMSSANVVLRENPKIVGRNHRSRNNSVTYKSTVQRVTLPGSSIVNINTSRDVRYDGRPLLFQMLKPASAGTTYTTTLRLSWTRRRCFLLKHTLLAVSQTRVAVAPRSFSRVFSVGRSEWCPASTGCTDWRQSPRMRATKCRRTGSPAETCNYNRADQHNYFF